MNLDQIKRNYEQLPDFKIIEMANYEANQLPPEVLKILINEIRIRNLSNNLLDAIEATTKELSIEELNEYIDLIRTLPDPSSGEKTKKLNATIISKTTSYFFFSQHSNVIFIGTPENIIKKIDEATLQTALLGWWGIKSIFYAIQSLKHNSKMSKIDYKELPSQALTEFVLENIGFIETNKKNTPKLIEFIKNSNK